MLWSWEVAWETFHFPTLKKWSAPTCQHVPSNSLLDIYTFQISQSAFNEIKLAQMNSWLLSFCCKNNLDLKIYLLSLLICKLDLRNQNFVQLRFILFSFQKSIYCGAHLSGIRFCCGVKFSLRSIKICKYLQRNISTMEIISQACRLIKAKVCSEMNGHFHKLVFFSLHIVKKNSNILT